MIINMSNTFCMTRSCEARFRNQTAKLTKSSINYCSESIFSEFKSSEFLYVKIYRRFKF